MILLHRMQSLFPFVALLVLQLGASAASAQPAPARPLDPATAIIEAFKTHDVVALGEGNHNNEQGAAFRQALYRDPRFQSANVDVVVESGNGFFQPVVDRYIAGEAVPEKELRRAWLETSADGDVWDRTIYADVFHTIHDINLKLPKAKRLRVLLGDTPYDPASTSMPQRFDTFTADLIQREVLAKKRKALVVYGGMHLGRRREGPPPEPDGAPPRFSDTIVAALEQARVKVLSIWTFAPSPMSEDLTALQADIAAWPKPSLAMIDGTTLGQAPFTFYYPKGSGMTIVMTPSGPKVTDTGELIGGVMQDRFDAVLYLGPKATITYAQLPKELCADADYVEMRAKRLDGQRFPPGAEPPAGAPKPSEAFRARCKAAEEAKQP